MPRALSAQGLRVQRHVFFNNLFAVNFSTLWIGISWTGGRAMKAAESFFLWGIAFEKVYLYTVREVQERS